MFNIDIQGLAMEIVLRKYGNSTVAVLPPALLKNLGLAAGQHMTLSTNEKGDIVLARKRKYHLAELVAQCDMKAQVPADIRTWDSAEPVGHEIL